MILHHFTSRACIQAVSVMGLTRGVIPWVVRQKVPGMTGPQMEFAQGMQWLTSNPDWKQDWCAPGIAGKLGADRTDYRITVSVPDLVRHFLYRWPDFCASQNPPMAPEINKLGDSTVWWVFKGVLPPHDFVSVERNPGFVDRTPVKRIVDGRGRAVGNN